MILIFYLLQDVVSSLLISNLIFLHYVVTTPAVFFVFGKQGCFKMVHMPKLFIIKKFLKPDS